MKKWVSKLLAVVMCFGLLASMPFNASALDDNDQDAEVASTSAVTTKTVTDNGNNRYKVSGYTSASGKVGSVYTDSYVSYYYGGTTADKTTVNGYTKKVTAKGSVTLSGGGTNSLGGTKSATGKTVTASYSVSYLYTVVYVAGTHTFSCNGGSTSFTTSASA